MSVMETLTDGPFWVKISSSCSLLVHQLVHLVQWPTVKVFGDTGQLLQMNVCDYISMWQAVGKSYAGSAKHPVITTV